MASLSLYFGLFKICVVLLLSCPNSFWMSPMGTLFLSSYRR